MKTARLAGRDPWFDDARWLAGSLVVLVHVNETLMASSALAAWLHPALYPARIPLFAMLVGYFTPRVPSSRDYASLVQLIIAPFFAVSAIHVALNWWWGVRPLFSPLVAQYTLWFMFSVIAWRLIVPVVLRFRYPLAVAVAVSLVSGAFESFWVLSLHRTFGLLPFVTLGAYLKQRDDWLRRRTARTTTWALLIIAAWMIGVTLTRHWGTYSGMVLGMWVEYPAGVTGLLGGMFTRALLLIAVGVTTLAFLHLMPRARIRWLTYVGAGGFTIYLLHGLVLRLLRHWSLLPTQADHWGVTLVMILFAFGLAALLGSKPVRWLARPLVRPKLNWLLRPNDVTRSASANFHAAPAASEAKARREQ